MGDSEMDRVKATYELTLRKVSRLPPQFDLTTVFVYWRRGSKKVSGITKRALVKGGEPVWDEKIFFDCILERESGSSDWDAKTVSFIVKQDIINAAKQTRSICKTSVDLAKHTKSDGSEVFSVKLTCGKSAAKGDEPVHLYYSVKAHLAKGAAGESGRGGGSGLLSDSTDGSASRELLAVDVDADAPYSANLSGDSTISLGSEEDQLDESWFIESDDPKVLVAKIEMLEAENLERMRMLRQREDQVEELKRKNSEMKKEMSRSTQLLTSEIETLRRQLSEERRSPAVGRSADAAPSSSVLGGSSSSTAVSAASAEHSAVALASGSGVATTLHAAEKPPEMKEALEKVANLERQLEAMRLNELSYKHQLQEKSWNIRVLEQRLGLSDMPATDLANPLLMKAAYEELSLLEATVYVPAFKFKAKRSVAALTLFNSLVEWQVLEAAPLHDKLLDRISAGLLSVASRGTAESRSFVLATITGLLWLIKSKLGYDVAAPAPLKDSPLSRFVEALKGASSDVFSQLLECVYAELEPVVISAFLEQPQLQLGANGLAASASPGPDSGVGGAGPELHSISASATVIPVLNRYVQLLLRQHFHGESMVRQFFAQVVRYMDATLLNALLGRRELCTCGNGFQIKVELSRLEEWVKETLQYSFRAELEYTLQASTLLVVEKRTFAQDGAIEAVCPKLNLSQVLKLLQLFSPDAVAPEPVPPEVFSWISGRLKHLTRGTLLLSPKLWKSPLSLDL